MRTKLRRAKLTLAGGSYRRRLVIIGAVIAIAAADVDGAVKRASSAIAITTDGGTVLVVNPDSGTLSVVDVASGSVTTEVEVGEDPRTVAVDEAGRYAWVTNMGSGTVSVVDLDAGTVSATATVGDRPYGVVVENSGERAYVAVQGTGQVAVLAAPDWRVVATVAVGDRPSGLAITGDGSTLLVSHLLTGTLSVIDTTTLAVSTIQLWPDSNLVQSVVLGRDDAVAWVPHTRSNTANTALTFDTTVFPLVSKVDVQGRQHLAGQHLSMDTIDPPGVGLPFDVALSDNATAWVVNAASNDVTVVDLANRRKLAHVEVGDNPRGIVLAPDNSRAYVNDTLAGTVSVIDAASFSVVETIQVTRIPLPPAMLLGKRLFWSSDDPRMARAQWIACASCHFDADHDGRTWRFGFAGPRNTTSLRGMVQSYPLRWSAEWNESADSDFAVTREQFGSGLLDGAMHDPLGPPNAESSYELDALAAYLDGLELPENTIRHTLDPGAVARGEALFFNNVTDCASCHPRPYFTDLAVHDVGTANGSSERLGSEIDTPTLRDLARSAPYLHDGSAATLAEVLTTANPDDAHGVTSHLSSDEVNDLVTFLLSLPAGNHACVSSTMEAAKTIASHADTSLPGPRRGGRRVGQGPVVRGRVVADVDGTPVAGALVSARATSVPRTLTDDDGGFALAVPAEENEVEIAAWAEGFYIASQVVTPPVNGIRLALRALHDQDNPDYRWIDPTPSQDRASACGNCHPAILPQWQGNAHGGAASNPRFFSFYNGTDIDGTTTVRPGYRLDFPETNGICGACHTPGRGVDRPFGADANAARDDLTSGIHCDFCHKVGGVFLQPKTREVYPNMAGVLSLEVLRPPEGEQVFFGPFPDIHDPDTYLPAMTQSAFCAPCHQFSFWGTPIYTSYEEWRKSPYADPDTGRTCQACHMAPNGDNYFVLPEQGGLWHPAEDIPSHLQFGARDAAFMATALTLDIKVDDLGDALSVTVTMTNTGTGHNLPTDHPGRHLLLEVEATGPDGQALALLQGPTIPDWGGSLAGRPGAGYAKLLEDVASGEWPVVSYWKQAVIREDSRLEAMAADVTTYRFERPSGAATVTVTVRFRKLFEDLATRYGWDLGELVMARKTVSVSRR
ncbi:MAG: beta-propeller fold lactonase family protein [Thermoanaerobaculales bacterium]